MRKAGLFLCLFLPVFILAGCGDDTEKIIGFWKSPTADGGWTSLLEFTKSRMVLDDDGADAAVEARDGKVVVRKAGTDTVLAIVTVVDDDNLDVEIDGAKKRFVKSDKEEYERLAAASPKARAIGFWKTKRGLGGQTVILEIGRDYISEDGKERLPLTLAMKSGGLVLLPRGEQGREQGQNAGEALAVTFVDDDHIEIASAWLGRSSYERIPPETAARILSPTPDLILGHWISGENVIEIGADSISVNGTATPIKFAPSRKAVLGLHPTDDKQELLRVSILEDGGITARGGIMPEDGRYSRATAEEAKAKLDVLAGYARAVVGAWITENGEGRTRGPREGMIIEADSFTKNDETSAILLRPMAGGVVEVVNSSDGGALTKVSIVDDTHVKLPGGYSGDVVFVRTTREGLNLLLHPTPEQAEGYWVSEEKNDWLPALNAVAMAPDSLTWNGVATPAGMEASDGEVIIKDKSGRVAARLAFTDPEHISLRYTYSQGEKSFRRASSQEVEAINAAYRAGWESSIGFWLSEREFSNRPGGRQNLEITRERVVYNSEKYSEYKPSYHDGKIYFTVDGNIERFYGFVEPLANGRLNTEFQAMDDGVFVRSTQEEVAELLTPNPAKALGFWVSEAKNNAGQPTSLLSMTENEINLNGERAAAHYASGEGQVVVETAERRSTIIRIRRLQPQRLVVNKNFDDTPFVRVTEDEFRRAWGEYEEQFRKNVLGYWKERGVGGRPVVLLIEPDRIAYNTNRPDENYLLCLNDGAFRILRKTGGSARVEIIGPDRIKYDFNHEFVRIGKDEYEQLLQQQRR